MYTIKRMADPDGEPVTLYKEFGSAIAEAKMRAEYKHEAFVVLDDKGIVQCVVYDLKHLELSVQPVEHPVLLNPKKTKKKPWWEQSTWFWITAGWMAAALFKIIYGRDVF